MEESKGSGVALLVMDVQDRQVSMVAEKSNETKDNLLKTVNTAIDAARIAKIPIIHVVIGFRKGCPEISDNNKMAQRIKQMTLNREDPKPHASVNVKPEDVVVTKRRVSAFSGSDLQVVLSSFNVNKLVLTGIATSGVVLSTLREAADKDFGLIVLSDGCADTDIEVHTVLMTKVFPRQADIMTSEEWIKSLTTKTA